MKPSTQETKKDCKRDTDMERSVGKKQKQKKKQKKNKKNTEIDGDGKGGWGRGLLTSFTTAEHSVFKVVVDSTVRFRIFVSQKTYFQKMVR